MERRIQKFRSAPRRLPRRSRARRFLDLLIAVVVFAGVAFLAARLEEGAGETIEGIARVVDGDSLVIDGRRLRLKGIDAPELRQTCSEGARTYDCGALSAAFLRTLTGGSPVACKAEGRDRYGRDLVRCRANGTDLNAVMVASGQAVAYGDYGREEREARAALLGLWKGEFDRPRDWRAVHGGLDEPLHDGLRPLFAFLRRFFGI